jgi:hypothetical protein
MALRVRNFARRNWPEPWEKAGDTQVPQRVDKLSSVHEVLSVLNTIKGEAL